MYTSCTILDIMELKRVTLFEIIKRLIPLNSNVARNMVHNVKHFTLFLDDLDDVSRTVKHGTFNLNDQLSHSYIISC